MRDKPLNGVLAMLPAAVVALAGWGGQPVLGAASTVPDRPTFTRDVLPILQESCQQCHRPQGLNLGGMVAPMPLVSYEDTRPWAKSIAKAVKSRYMPPWHASPQQHGVFEGERTLTEEEITTLVRWASTGAVRGQAQDAPPPKEFPQAADGWSIGKPDLILAIEPYFVKDDVEDLYITFEVPIPESQLPEDRWIKAVEFRPGSKVVHHVIARPIGGIAPGYQPRVFRDGYSTLLRKGTTARFQMHYHKEPGPGTGAWDETRVGVRFYEPGQVIRHVMKGDPLATRGFRIPPGDPNYSHDGSYTFEEDAYVMGFNPHMHLRGKAARAVAHYPDGEEKLLLHVPQYDFNWQTTYTYKEPVFVPRGTKVHLTLWWDNSPENPSNPDPTREVTFGGPTTDEMGFGWMRYVSSEPDNIVVEVAGASTTGGDK